MGLAQRRISLRASCLELWWEVVPTIVLRSSAASAKIDGVARLGLSPRGRGCPADSPRRNTDQCRRRPLCLKYGYRIIMGDNTIGAQSKKA